MFCIKGVVLCCFFCKLAMETAWHHPFTSVISGPSQSGKTVFVEKLLKHRNEMMSPVPKKIIWSYGVRQPALEAKWRGVVQFVEGLPDSDSLSDDSLVIIDDQMAETDQSVANLFTKGSHHHKLSVVLIVQNLFGKNPHMRTISLNSHYLVVFKNPRDASQASHLGKQMYPRKLKYFQAAYKDATSVAHGYLLCDLRQETPDHLRLRTSIFPEDPSHIVYVEK